MINYEWFRTPWVAVRTDDPAAVFQPIGLSGFSVVDWEAGMKAVFQQNEKLFVSPVIQGWVLFFGEVAVILERYFELHKMGAHPACQDPDCRNPNCKDPNWFWAISQMSSIFYEVQFFVSYESIWQHARAVQGKVERAYFVNSNLGEYGEIGAPSEVEIYHGATFIEALHEKSQEFLTSELPFLMAGIWSINPLEFDEPKWDWLKSSQGLIYNSVSDTQRDTREWLENWKKDLKQADMEDKYGIKINRLN